jgi:nicotine blue oxidoreductase
VTVAGLLLAAGGGSRLGRPKAGVEYDGSTLAARGVATLRAGGCDPVLVVLGPVDVEVDADVVRNPRWASGMGSSLRVGLAALPPGTDAVVVALADQPLVGAAAVARLVAAWQGGAVAAVATYAGAPRNPVLLDRSVWVSVAAAADGDEGARPWLRAHPERVAPVACDGTGSPYDVDTPEDLARLEGTP